MVEYCRGLKFEENPNYSHLYKLIKNVFDNTGMEYDYKFDWSISIGMLTETSSRMIQITEHSKHIFQHGKKIAAENENNIKINNDDKCIKETGKSKNPPKIIIES